MHASIHLQRLDSGSPHRPLSSSGSFFARPLRFNNCPSSPALGLAEPRLNTSAVSRAFFIPKDEMAAIHHADRFTMPEGLIQFEVLSPTLSALPVSPLVVKKGNGLVFHCLFVSSSMYASRCSTYLVVCSVSFFSCLPRLRLLASLVFTQSLVVANNTITSISLETPGVSSSPMM